MCKKILVILAILIVNVNFSQEYSRTGSEVSPNEVKQLIDQHNFARSEVGVSNVEWSEKLASIAQNYANYLARTSCNLIHSNNHKLGENLFWGSGKYFSALDASASWYEEKELYTYEQINEYNNQNVGHYTQMIWKNTKFVGFELLDVVTVVTFMLLIIFHPEII
jgi:pathogenesis-related protein 1